MQGPFGKATKPKMQGHRRAKMRKAILGRQLRPNARPLPGRLFSAPRGPHARKPSRSLSAPLFDLILGTPPLVPRLRLARSEQGLAVAPRVAPLLTGPPIPFVRCAGLWPGTLSGTKAKPCSPRASLSRGTSGSTPKVESKRGALRDGRVVGASACIAFCRRGRRRIGL